ncbi:MAG: folate-binding protein YgfZ [Burkholderiales bacterium]|nr:folate-binding protein YgfZ [Burkholderiales bacterium]
MNEQWAQFLHHAGADPGAHGSGPRGLEYAREGCFICDLSWLGLAEFAGPDAASFLHGQLSNDVQALAPGRIQLAAYNTPKGRALGALLLWRTDAGFLAQLPASIADGIVRRLSLYILRAKVKAANVSERYVRIGVGGPQAQSLLARSGFALPGEEFAVSTSDEAAAMQPSFVLRLPLARYELLYGRTEAAISVWERLSAAGAKPAGPAPWQWLSVRSGIADIVPETQDKFVPQMLNLDLVGGISFDKGCYPGQEIVARTQYRGEIKRRTVLGHSHGEMPVRVGEDVFDANAPDQAIGSIVAAAAAPAGGYDVLACLHLELAQRADLHIGHPHGPALERSALPYPVPVPL